jgi:PAS domain S-box-containing protein
MTMITSGITSAVIGPCVAFLSASQPPRSRADYGNVPPSPLERLRLVLLLGALASLAAAAAMVLTASPAPPGERGAGMAVIVALAVYWVRGFRRRAFAPAALLPEGLAILAILVTCHGNAPVPLLGLLFRGLYGGSGAATSRTVATTRIVVYIMALYLAPVLGGAETHLDETTSRAVGLLLAGWIMPTLQRALERLERDERRLRTIVEHSSDVVTIVRADLRVRWQGGSIRAVLGHEPDDIVGQSLLELLHPEDVAEVRTRLQELATSPQATAMVSARIRDADGRYREVEAVVSNRLDDPDVEGLVVSTRDMAAHRRVERLRERLEAQRERQQLEGQLQRARRLESVGQLAGGVAHDFNNLLAVIVNCAALARDELPAGHAAGTEIAAIEDAADRGARLIRQLLLFSQNKAGAPQLLDINALVRGLDTLLSHTLGRHISLRYELDPQPAVAQADLSSLEQVLVNLVVNARDAVGAGGTIEIRTANVVVDSSESVELEVPSGPYVRMSVADDGCGMDADTLARACEPFFTTKGPGKGTGLGLATVFGVARQAGGCVTIDSHAGTGTTVHLHLPAAVAVEAQFDLEAVR